MSEITFACPHCGRDYQVDAGLAGKKARCKGCQEVMRIPREAAPPPGPAEPDVLRFPCPRCGYGFNLEPRFAGKKARCKSCGEVFRVPEHPAPAFAFEPDEDGDGYGLSEPPVAPPDPTLAAARSGPDTAHPARAGLPGTPSRHADAEEEPSPFRRWLGYRAKILALAAGLGLLGWAFTALVPRAWDAGQAMLGGEGGSPNDPVPPAGDGTAGADDPDLAFPEISPDRAGAIAQHREALEMLGTAFNEVAQGFVGMRDPARFAEAQQAVGRGFEKVDAAGKKGASLPKLSDTEKSVLVPFVDRSLSPALSRALREVRQLKQTPGIKGDFDRLEGAIAQTSAAMSKEYSGSGGSPSAMLLIDRDLSPAEQKFVMDRAGKLRDDLGSGGVGLGGGGGKTHVKVTPVLSARAFADRIDFGKVKRVDGRRIEIEVTPPADVVEAKAQPAPKHAEDPPAQSPQSRTARSEPRPDAGSSQPTSPPGVAGGPTILALRWVDDTSDRIGPMDATGRPDGHKDQHLQVEFEFPGRADLESLAVMGRGNDRWVTQPSDRYWPLGVYQGDRPIARTYAPMLGTFSGKQTLDLYGNTSGDAAGTEFRLEARVKARGQVQTLTARCRRP